MESELFDYQAPKRVISHISKREGNNDDSNFPCVIQDRRAKMLGSLWKLRKINMFQSWIWTSRAGWFQLKKYILICSFIHACSVTQSCLTLCDLMDGSPPGSSVHGTFQEKNTGVCCYFFLRASSQCRVNLCLLRLLHWQAESLPLNHLGSPSYPLNLNQLITYCVSTLYLNLWLLKKQETFLSRFFGWFSN